MRFADHPALRECGNHQAGDVFDGHGATSAKTVMVLGPEKMTLREAVTRVATRRR